MKSFKSHLFEEYQELAEKLITFGGQAYPKFGNIIILAGGAGSGKGFVKDKLIGAEGHTFDVDELKKLVGAAPKIREKVQKGWGVDVKKISSDLKNPDNVAQLHYVVADYLKVDDKRQQALFASILTANPERKPNIIFDVTLKNEAKLRKISDQVQALGYDKKNIHIVWIVNDIEVAIRQNAARDRVVPLDILVDTHRGASVTMHSLVKDASKLAKYMDGELVFAFNKVDIDKKIFDSTWSSRDKKDPRAQANQNLRDKGLYTGKRKKGKHDYNGGSFVHVDYVVIKKSGQKPIPYDKIKDDVKRKIAKYVPKNVNWD